MSTTVFSQNIKACHYGHPMPKSFVSPVDRSCRTSDLSLRTPKICNVCSSKTHSMSTSASQRLARSTSPLEPCTILQIIIPMLILGELKRELQRD